MAYAPTRPKVLHVGAKAGQLLVPVRRMDLKPWVVGMCVVPHINRF